MAVISEHLFEINENWKKNPLAFIMFTSLFIEGSKYSAGSHILEPQSRNA